MELSAKKSWTDPYVGLCLQHPLAERLTFLGYADIGGFGVASDFTWQALVGVNYEFSKAIAGKALLSVYERGLRQGRVRL